MATNARGDSFPAHFLWGAATSGYQIEGGATADGKGESIWDRFARTPGKTLHGDTGDRACNAYDDTQLAGDLDLMSALGLNAYIFSVQWSRVQPTGRGKANAKGLDYYRRLVDQLNRRGITPVLTLYHWELPQALQDRGGWLARDTVDRFVDYAAIVYDTLAAEVPLWVTQNEPHTSAWLGHAEGVHAPGIEDVGSALTAAHHLLLAHGRATAELRHRVPGVTTRFGPVLNMTPYRAENARNQRHRAAAMRLDGERNRLFFDALFRGRYPADVERRYRAQTRDFGFVKAGDAELIATPVDFVGINYYQPVVVAAHADGSPLLRPPRGPQTGMGWAIDPAGLGETLRRVQAEYTHDVPLIVSENGAAFPDYVDPEGRCNDPERIDFLRDHLREALKALEDGVRLKGYFVWSLLDNFEWNSGYRERFGLVHVDYATQRRTPKASFYWYCRCIAANAAV
jgi:beta-glucosidase